VACCPAMSSSITRHEYSAEFASCAGASCDAPHRLLLCGN
jgi:hypothetical protein